MIETRRKLREFLDYEKPIYENRMGVNVSRSCADLKHIRIIMHGNMLRN